ncbi:MAG: Na+/H+ antiporter NhaC family protein [Anaerovoracaceae bacterium]|jgi:Na+/H+ antiporter NhaC
MNGLLMLFKLSPIFVLSGLVVGGFDMLMSAPAALLYATIVCWLTTKRKVMDILESALTSVKNAMMVFFILMMAYAVATFFMSTGVGASIIIGALKLGVSGRSVAVVAFIVSCVLSMATGTSWGTFAATIPIFMWLGHIVGGDPIMTMCACAGGAAFGDNVALISDTTIMTCGIQGVEVVDRFNKQLVWSLSNVGLATILFYVTGLIKGLPAGTVDASNAISDIPADAWATLEEERPAAVELLNQVSSETIPLWMMIPVIIIIGMAIFRLPTLVCLAAGIVSATLMGAFIGTVGSFGNFLQMLYDSFADAGSWVVIMVMWVIFFGGVMREMGAFKPLAIMCMKLSKKVRHLMFCNAILCIIGNMLLSDDQAQMATMGPVIRDIVDEGIEGSEEDLYNLRCRNAMYGDAIGVLTGELIPWHVCNVYYVGLTAAVYPLVKIVSFDLIPLNFFAWISILSLLILTLTGADRFLPNFGIPREPAVRLKKEEFLKKESIKQENPKAEEFEVKKEKTSSAIAEKVEEEK